MTRRLTWAIVCVAITIGCGGGGSGGGTPTTPTTPPPSPGLPSGGACGALGSTASQSLDILNGSECPTGASAVVLLNMRDSANSPAGACSGTVISQRAILTAAHCIEDDVRSVRMYLGSGPEVVAESFVAHPDYGGTTTDVAIVIMAQPIGRTPIPVLLSRDARVGESAVIAGWGRNQFDIPSTLRAGTTTITAAGSLLETQFSASVSSVCSGDSGGPILLSEGGVWSVAGVTSATSQNVCNTGTNFYVPVRSSSISSFILSHVPDAARR